MTEAVGVKVNNTLAVTVVVIIVRVVVVEGRGDGQKESEEEAGAGLGGPSGGKAALGEEAVDARGVSGELEGESGRGRDVHRVWCGEIFEQKSEGGAEKFSACREWRGGLCGGGSRAKEVVGGFSCYFVECVRSAEVDSAKFDGEDLVGLVGDKSVGALSEERVERVSMAR